MCAFVLSLGLPICLCSLQRLTGLLRSVQHSAGSIGSNPLMCIHTAPNMLKLSHLQASTPSFHFGHYHFPTLWAPLYSGQPRA